MGGLSVAEDIAKFQNNVHIVVGSPGRLRHLIQRKHIDVSCVRVLVLDEADKLMEKSFLADINYIFSILPNQKQVIMSSATYPEATKTFINKYVKCAQHICPDSNCVLLGVEQKITIVKSNPNIVRQTQYRFEELLKILSKKQFKQCLIFCNYQARVHELYNLLIHEKWPVEQLCGNQEQSDRLDALKTLQEYKCRILISTDLAARGIDASNVDLVINFEPPFEWHTYLHRIGRAGRYGSYGIAITILGEGKEEKTFKQMLESINFNALEITNFWTSNLDNDEQSLNSQPSVVSSNKVLNTELEIDYSALWEELCSNNVIEKVIDNFEVLCNSFEISKHPVIEPFTDLISSFKASEDTFLAKDNSTYKHMTFKPVVKKSNRNVMTTKSVKLSDKSNDSYIKPVITNSFQKENYVKDKNDNDVFTVSYYNNITKNERSQEKPKYNNRNVTKCGSYEENRYDQYFNKYEEIEALSNKALKDAGLPLAFGSHVRKGVHTKDDVKKTMSKPNNKNYKIKTSYEGTNSCGHRSQRTFYDSCLNPSNKHTKKSQNCTIKNGPNDSKPKFTYLSNNSQDYINWYKQLKARVKYIELAFYVDELSRL